MTDRLRYLFGVWNVTIIPVGLLFWFVIHLWARSWRRIGTITYLIILPPLVALGVVLFRFRAWILGADLGVSRILIAIAVILYAVMGWLEIKTWKQLSISIAAGIPEVSRHTEGMGKLLKDGPYRLVRHPRYLSAGVGVIANSFIINHVGMYVMILLVYPAGFVMLMFEERELVDRFGEEYRQYQREVPKIIPRFGKAK